MVVSLSSAIDLSKYLAEAPKKGQQEPDFIEGLTYRDFMKVLGDIVYAQLPNNRRWGAAHRNLGGKIPKAMLETWWKEPFVGYENRTHYMRAKIKGWKAQSH